MEESDNALEALVWKILWDLKVPPKVKHFLWRAAYEILPTKDHLWSKQILVDPGVLFVVQTENPHIISW